MPYNALTLPGAGEGRLRHQWTDLLLRREAQHRPGEYGLVTRGGPPHVQLRRHVPIHQTRACTIGVPFVVAVLGGALTGVAGPVSQNSGLHGLAGVALVLIVLGTADRLARRAGLNPM